MPNVLNQRMLKEIKGQLEKASDCVVIDFTAVSVADVSEMRARMRKSDMRMKVMKTSLARIAAKELGFEGADDLFKGTTAILYGGESIGSVAKAFEDFAKEKKEKAPKVRGAFLEKRKLEGAAVAALAKMPSRQQLLSELLGAITAPLSNIAGLMNTLMTDIRQRTQALHDKGGAAGGEAAAPEAAAQ